jgi:hypothetical protein
MWIATIMNAGGESMRPTIPAHDTASARQHIHTHMAAIGLALLLSAIVLPLEAGMPARRDSGPTARLRVAIEVGCRLAHADLEHMAAKLDATAGVEHAPIIVRENVIGWRRRFVWSDGSEIRLERIAPRGQLRRVSAEYRRATSSGLRPEILAVSGGDCGVRLGRQLVYDEHTGQATMLQQLDRELRPTGESEPVNPAVPEGTDPGGLAVALVDAGVNYLLPAINMRLARDPDGKILGYDFWDLDDRPFDANPARSVFFPQRHGTRTASIILREAPGTRLVPYRYPRPDMSRMARLVDDAAAKGILIANLSMGSNKREDWTVFADAVKAHPDMLFVVSAGNNGRDIDQQPVYPAALLLPNLITVTSAEATGELARGSNNGAQAVDLLVPGENMEVTGFRGQPIRVSGSSYAAARTTALAARLLLQNPDWRAPQLKAAIFARSLRALAGERRVVSQGFIPDPERAEKRATPATESPLRQLDHQVLDQEVLYPEGAAGLRFTHALRPSFAYLSRTRWSSGRLRAIAVRVAEILTQCSVVVSAIDVHRLDGPETLRYYRLASARELVGGVSLSKPTVYFVRDTLQRDAYDAEAIGKGNSSNRPTLIYTVWVTEGIADPGISVTHELIHLLADSGEHIESSRNLMRADTSPENVELSSAQCKQIINAGEKNGLLRPMS